MTQRCQRSGGMVVVMFVCMFFLFHKRICEFILFRHFMQPVRCRTVPTNTLHHVVDEMHLEVFRQCHRWDGRIFQAEGTMTDLAIEVDVHVVQRTFVFAAADLVFQHPTPVLDGVNQAVFEEERQRAENRRLIHRIQPLLQLRNGDRPLCP